MTDEGESKVSEEPAANSSGQTPPSRCRICKKPMPAGAVKCTECQSYQDWRRFVFSWTGLIGAVLTVVGAMITIYFQIRPVPPVPPARLAISFERCLSDRIVMLVTNDGGRRATVGPPRFTITTVNGSSPLDMTGLWDTDPFESDDREADPGETDDQTYPNDLYGFFDPNSIPPGCRIAVRVPILNGGPPDEVKGDCACGYSR